MIENNTVKPNESPRIALNNLVLEIKYYTPDSPEISRGRDGEGKTSMAAKHLCAKSAVEKIIQTITCTL